jgi:2-oxoglutarate dehydrogenase E2 component (dihydrolipoamide succinyltransferase)
MPQLGESVVEGTVARWLKAPGDSIDKLEPLLEISTDKIDTEIPAPATGTLLAILAQAGATVTAGAVLAYIGSPSESIPVAQSEPVPTVQDDVTDAEQEKSSEPDRETATTPSGGAPSPGGRDFISPVVARIAAEHGVDLTRISGTGLAGRITKKDILAFIEAEEAVQSDAAAPPAPGVPSEPSTAAETVIEPLSHMRRLIAEHMVLSKRTSPHVTTVMEVDMTAVVRHREAGRLRFAERGISLTYTAYFLAATAAALRAVPAANSRFTEQGIELHRRIHIGMAVAVEQGLIVPVLRDVDEMNLQGIARAVQDLTRRGREGKLQADEIQGGTFTVTNHGTAGSLVATPIINQPQAGILGVGAIVKRPVVRSSGPSLLPDADDAIVIRPMCYLSFTFDHRILDGANADRWLGVVKSTLEHWS